jgi:hypothetical protein
MEKELTDMTVDARIGLGPGGEVLSTWIPRTSLRRVAGSGPATATHRQSSERT